MSRPPDDDPDSERHLKPFIEHLVDLRRSLLRSLAALVVGMAVAVPLAPHVFRLLKAPLVRAGKDPDTFLKVLEVTGGFRLALVLVLLTGLVISAPLIVFFAADFVFPGLTRRERRAVLRFGLPAVVLFLGGVALAYFVVLPLAINVMLDIAPWIGVKVDFLMAGDYASFCLYMLLAFGLAFELPVVVVLLGDLGLITSRQLRGARSYVVVGILFVAMVITPTTDAFTMLVMAVPLIVLHEAATWIVWLRERGREGAAGE